MGILRADGTEAAQPEIEYASGGFSFKTPAQPGDLLQLALAKSRQVMARQDPIGATQLDNPFIMEPAAQAVFMFLVQEVQALNERLANLEAAPDADAE
jgi:hypothetical protein